MDAGSDQEVASRFLGARQHQRTATEDRSQKNLQAAITTNVIERAPHDGASRAVVAVDRSRQGRQIVQDQLRPTGVAGCKKDPFRLVACAPLGIDR